MVGVTHKLYINLIANKAYHFNGENFEEINTMPAASKEVAGIMKLYDVVGENTDGTMTQKAISDELAKKFEIEISSDEELIIFK
jgi:aromatic ring hydroxylase